MVYTLWENTPLKWHKFLTFFLLPLGSILNVCQAILAISDIQNWTGILIPVNIIDLIRFIACAILGITAIYGCLPSRRRWYGPKCAIILYAVLSIYSIYNIIAAYLLSVADSEFISQNIANLISFSLTSGLMYIYYKKRRLLFSNSNISDQQRHVKQGTEIQCSKSEPENSVELLMEIQKDSESTDQDLRNGGDLTSDEKGLLKRLKRARILFACSVVVILIITGVFIYSRGNLLNKIDSMQTELDVIEENYERLKEQYNDIRSQKNEMQSELNFWQDYAVITTEYGEKYHTYGCQYIEGRDFWIYNIAAAIGRGYEPCSVCNPPRP